MWIDVCIEFLGTILFVYLILSYAHLSMIKGNFNPLVTIIMVAAKKQHINTVLPYLFAQIAGAFLVLYFFI